VSSCPLALYVEVAIDAGNLPRELSQMRTWLDHMKFQAIGFRQIPGVIAGGGRVDLLEGDPMPERVFIIEFPTADVARRWYRSNDYQEALKARLSASHGRVLLLEGNEVSTVAPVAGMDVGKG